MQTLQVIGNLGIDAEVKEKDGRQFVTFKVADTSKWTDNKGTVHEDTVWISCVLNGDGGNILQYLRKGVKVFLSGRPQYRLYSSAKERCMKVSVDLSVNQIELCGGSSDDVPRQVVTSDGVLHDVSKHYWTDPTQLAGAKECFDTKGRNAYSIDPNGFIRPIVQATEQVQAAEQVQTTTAEPQKEQQAVEVFGDALQAKLTNTKKGSKNEKK